MTYRQLLKDPRWQRRRLEIMQRDAWRCTTCQDGSRKLNVHHVRYERGRQPWEYPGDDLRTLCEACHQKEHGRGDEVARRRAMALIGEALKRAAADPECAIAPVADRAINLLEEAFPA